MGFNSAFKGLIHKRCKNLFYLLESRTLLTYLLTYLVTHPYLLTPCSTVLLEKRNQFSVKKFPTFYGTGRFITAFTSARHLCISWARSIQSIPPHPTS